MGWPYDGGLWRDNAKPAQEQYANVAKAISEFEPLIMFADPEVSSGLNFKKNQRLDFELRLG